MARRELTEAEAIVSAQHRFYRRLLCDVDRKFVGLVLEIHGRRCGRAIFPPGDLVGPWRDAAKQKQVAAKRRVVLTVHRAWLLLSPRLGLSLAGATERVPEAFQKGRSGSRLPGSRRF